MTIIGTDGERPRISKKVINEVTDILSKYSVKNFEESVIFLASAEKEDFVYGNGILGDQVILLVTFIELLSKQYNVNPKDLLSEIGSLIEDRKDGN